MVKVAETEKVCTFATAFERESRWRWQTGRAEAMEESAGCCTEYLTLRCARERERVSRTPSENLLKNFFKKNFRKNLEVTKKTPYLCKRFPAETGAWEKIVLWKTLDKQTKCSTSSSHVIYIMCIRDEVIKPSIWLNNQETFGHLNRGKKYSQE